jgi:hypothetical protein
MATIFNTRVGNRQYGLQFETDDEEKFSFVEKAARKVMDKTDEGVWLAQADGTHFCSCCGKDVLYNFSGEEMCSNYCPHCGLIMKKVENYNDEKSSEI